MTQHIIFDCDDVLLNWAQGFKLYCSAKLGRDIVGDPPSWQMGEWLSMTDCEAFTLIEEFNSGELFGFLQPIRGAVEEVSRMVTSGRNSLHVVTSCSSDAKTVSRRRDNLERVFGKRVFDTIHCLDLGESKKKILQAWEPGAIWVEDNYKNALLGAEVGHETYMMQRRHNLEYFDKCSNTNITWVEDWPQLAGYIF